MKIKAWLSSILAGLLFLACMQLTFAADAEYISLKDHAELNGFTYTEYDNGETVNLKNVSYILAFCNGSNSVTYKTVLGDQGVIELLFPVIGTGEDMQVSKQDAETKLFKYMPVPPDSPSDWAVDEVNEAIDAGFATGAARRDYQANISREIFCGLVVNMYETMTGDSPIVYDNPFTDTADENVLKAYDLGIVNGVSATQFAPANPITRQEICVMLMRAIGAMYPEMDLFDTNTYDFTDKKDIAPWAIDAVQFCFENGIVNGVGNDTIAPLGNATCEQSILLTYRLSQNQDAYEHKNEADSHKSLKETEFYDNSGLKSVEVTVDDSGNAHNIKVAITNDQDDVNNTAGIVGTGIEVKGLGNLGASGAELVFTYSPDTLNGTSAENLAIAQLDSTSGRMELLNSSVNTVENIIVVQIYDYGRYVIVDCTEWFDIWKKHQTISRKTDTSGNYTENFSVQLVVDSSGSMAEGTRMDRAEENTIRFIQKLSKNDKFSVIRFESSAYELIPFTNISDMSPSDMTDVENTIRSMSPGGGTNYDGALKECLNTMQNDSNYQNIIVFLSDGESQVSDQTLNDLRSAGVRVATIALGSESNTKELQKIATETNGSYIYAETDEDLDAIFDAIHGSVIGVDSTDTDGDGIADIVETVGMRNQYGNVIKTDPYAYDTDGDGISDGVEMGALIETNNVTEAERNQGITKKVYFEMVSDPTK